MKRALPIIALLGTSVRATAVADQLQNLRGANTAVERIAALGDDGDFVFHFLDPGNKRTKGAGGEAIGASVGNFPALHGAGLAMTLGFMQPCSMNTPHTHPRSAEVLLLLNGTQGIQSGFLAENGARFVMNTIHPYEAAVFPRGSIHFQANLGCEPVMFVATLNTEDPGTLQVAQRFFALPADVVGAALGGLGVQEVGELAKLIPDNLSAATEACFKKCNLTPPAKGSQPTAQQQAPAPAPSKPAIGGQYMAEPGGHDKDDSTFEDKGTPVNWLSDAPPSEPSGSDKPKHQVLAATDGADDDTKFPEKAKHETEAWFKDLPHDGTKIALLSLVLLNVLALVGLVVFLCVRRAKRRVLARNGGMHVMPTGVSTRNISGPTPLVVGAGSAARGKYEPAKYELPLDDAASMDTVTLATGHKYDDPYDRPASRGPSPVPPAHTGPYRD